MVGGPMKSQRPIIGTSPEAGAVIAPLALYVHVPWCVRKCPYCDFNSHAAPVAGVPGDAYVAAALADLDHELERRPARREPVISIYFGGGTPSLLEPAAVADLLAGFRARLVLAGDVEVTLEANPGTIERGRFARYADAGVNRISLGVQSFDEGLLRRLGRIHSADEARSAAAELHAAGLENFNIDLMYGLPGQDRDMALADIDAATALAPRHLSWYELTLEPGTAFFRKPPILPAEPIAAAIEDAGRERLARAGYRRYEISAFAREGARSRHNENYWRFGDYIGIGPGAHGKRSAGATVERTERIRSPARWLRLAGSSEAVDCRPVVPGERPFEFMLGALRRLDGFSWGRFEQRTGLAPGRAAGVVARARRDGLLTSGGDGLRPTPRGLRYLNDLQAAFLPD